MNAESALREARMVGLITLATGVTLTAAPGRVGPLFGVEDRSTARLLGLADLALVPGLLGGTPRWPWTAARAVVNLPMAAVLARGPRTAGRVVALALTVRDAQVARTLHRERR
ncbi:hypothetical protein EXU48_13925 [Occultella glacieicola]|uniref:Uncharacterized protein n=1 Tax=Occultella glacieicola TaxID=2518684 RepID=A0ABY2E243_9MICO|nr:hypothetical protein [Occultella glacieicola]TDE92631.1 hypothetical protein EXU48_13925 [Occultella glacieicola]